MNRRGTPANLVAAHPGNANATRYGIHSPTRIHELAGEIEAELFENSTLSPIERVAAHEVATLLAMNRQIDLDLGERGLVDKRGDPRYLVAMRLRVSRQLERWSNQLSNIVDEEVDAEADRAAQIQQVKRMALGEGEFAPGGHDFVPSHIRLLALHMLLNEGTEDAEPLVDLSEMLMDEADERAAVICLWEIGITDKDDQIREYFAERRKKRESAREARAERRKERESAREAERRPEHKSGIRES
jgi:hypothetical protein